MRAVSKASWGRSLTLWGRSRASWGRSLSLWGRSIASWGLSVTQWGRSRASRGRSLLKLVYEVSLKHHEGGLLLYEVGLTVRSAIASWDLMNAPSNIFIASLFHLHVIFQKTWEHSSDRMSEISYNLADWVTPGWATCQWSYLGHRVYTSSFIPNSQHGNETTVVRVSDW